MTRAVIFYPTCVRVTYRESMIIYNRHSRSKTTHLVFLLLNYMFHILFNTIYSIVISNVRTFYCCYPFFLFLVYMMCNDTFLADDLTSSTEPKTFLACLTTYIQAKRILIHRHLISFGYSEAVIRDEHPHEHIWVYLTVMMIYILIPRGNARATDVWYRFLSAGGSLRGSARLGLRLQGGCCADARASPGYHRITLRRPLFHRMSIYSFGARVLLREGSRPSSRACRGGAPGRKGCQRTC